MTKADKVIFATLITFSLLSILFMNVFLGCGKEKYVVIETNGFEYARYKLSEKNINTIEINTEFGYNRIDMSSEFVKMTDSNCKDKSCVHSKPIYSGGMIVCLPNKCVVRIEAKGGLDGVAY